MHSHYSYSSPSPPLHSQPKQYPHIHTHTNTSTHIKNTTTLYTKITLQATSCPVPSNINTHGLKLFHAHLPPPPPQLFPNKKYLPSYLLASLTYLPEVHTPSTYLFHCLPVYLRYIHPPLTFSIVYLST